MNPCIAGWCGPTRRNRNAFDSTISAPLETISTTAGLMGHLPNNPDEDMIKLIEKGERNGKHSETRKGFWG